MCSLSCYILRSFFEFQTIESIFKLGSEASDVTVDIGGGITQIAVISLGGIVVSKTIKVGGDSFDEAIVKYVHENYNMLIGERTAENVKIKIGEVYEHGEAKLVGAEMEHLRMDLVQKQKPNTTIQTIAFQQPTHYEWVRSGRPIDVCYQIVENHYRGTVTTQLRIKDIKPVVK